MSAVSFWKFDRNVDQRTHLRFNQLIQFVIVDDQREVNANVEVNANSRAAAREGPYAGSVTCRWHMRSPKRSPERARPSSGPARKS